MLEGEPTWRYGKDSRNGINGEALQNFNTNFSKGGLTPLMYAARQGSTAAVRALIDAGASPSTTDPEGFAPLQLAIVNGHYDTAAALIEKGADVNQADRSGQTPLFAVADMRSLLWAYNRPTPRARTTLDSLGLAKLLLAKGAKVDAKLTGPARRPLGGGGSALTGRGATAFLRAAVASDLPMMRLLLEHGADAKVATANGVTALHAAAGLRWSDNAMSSAVTMGLGHRGDVARGGEDAARPRPRRERGRQSGRHRSARRGLARRQRGRQAAGQQGRAARRDEQAADAASRRWTTSRR